MTHEIRSDTAMISKDTHLIKEYTAGLTKQLEKQDEILKQIAWLRAVVSKKSFVNDDKAFMMEKYLDSLTDYAGSACGDSVSEDIAQTMNLLSLSDCGASAPSIETVSSKSLSQGSESMTLVIGNTHRLVTPQQRNSECKHMWTFYIRVSEPEIVEEVRIDLVRDFLHALSIQRSLGLNAANAQYI